MLYKILIIISLAGIYLEGILLMSCLLVFFFFQAEDGIRDHCVTGVQTCALPISTGPNPLPAHSDGAHAPPDGTRRPVEADLPPLSQPYVFDRSHGRPGRTARDSEDRKSVV